MIAVVLTVIGLACIAVQIEIARRS